MAEGNKFYQAFCVPVTFQVKLVTIFDHFLIQNITDYLRPFPLGYVLVKYFTPIKLNIIVRKFCCCCYFSSSNGLILCSVNLVSEKKINHGYELSWISNIHTKKLCFSFQSQSCLVFDLRNSLYQEHFYLLNFLKSLEFQQFGDVVWIHIVPRWATVSYIIMCFIKCALYMCHLLKVTRK